MATLASLTALVVNIMQDASLTASIPGKLNQGVAEIAGGMPSTFGSLLTPPLPNLFTIDTVDTATDAAYVSMPATYQRDLQFVIDGNGTEIQIANSFIAFTESNPLLDRSGSIYEVAEKGGNLYYQGIPTSSETLTLHFYRLPIDMSEDSDVPDGIPLHLQIPLLVNYTAWKLFELIEDGIEGENVNTMKYFTLFSNALRTLELTVSYDIRGMELL
jgi:hypothetical protein